MTKQTVTVTYEGKTATFEVTVEAKDPSKPDYTGERIVIGKDSTTIADAVKAINTAIKKNTAKESYIFVIDSEITEKKAVALPKGNISVVLLSENGGKLTLSSPTITANCDLTIDCDITAAKPVTLKAAKDKTLTINNTTAKIGTIKVTVGDGTLEAFAYKKDVRAMLNGALTVGDTDYPDFEQAFAAMQESGEYEVVLNRNVTAAKLTLPKTVKKLTINGNGNAVEIAGAVSLASKYPFVLKKATIKSSKNGTAQAVTINAQGGLTLDNVTFDAKSVTLKGKGQLDLGNCGKIDTISGFNSAKTTGAVAIAKSLNVPTIELADTAAVTLDGKNATITAKTKLSGAEGAKIVLKNGFKALSFGTATGNIELVPDGISGTVQVFATKMTIDDIKKVFSVKDGELSSAKSGKVDLTLN